MSSLMRKYPIIVNLLIIIVVAFIGVMIANISLAIFTRHGEYNVVPNVEKISYTNAIEKLHGANFKIEISDSVFRNDIAPGYVLEQNPAPNAKVKPGRTVYLIINAVNPKQVAVSNIEGISLRQGKALLQGLGFKENNIKVIYRLGKYENLIQSVRVGGKKLRPGQRVPINSTIVLEVSDGKVDRLTDSLLNAENGVDYVDSYDESYASEGDISTESGSQLIENQSSEEIESEREQEEYNSLME